MRILLCNKFYYRRGGDCIVTMNLEQLLKSHGQEVAIFAMDYPENIDSQWKSYWPSNMSKIKVLTRPFGDEEVKSKFVKLIDDFKPDVIHLHNIHTQLSPVIAKIAYERRIKVFWTLHDTKLVCSCYTCSRNGQWCEECFSDKFAVIKHRCMHDSLLGSVIGYFESKKWNSSILQKYTTKFLPPSKFLADACIRAGFDKSKFEVLCNFIDIKKVENPSFDKQDYYCFLGRISEEKGIRTLCKVASMLPYKLKVIGGGPLLNELKENFSDVEFLGQLDWNSFRPILEGARFMVLPSECSENNPLTVIESLSLGTPVLGSCIGGIPELIEEDVNGMTFEMRNEEDLKNKIKKMWNSSFDYRRIAMTARERYGSETYYDKIMEIYSGK